MLLNDWIRAGASGDQYGGPLTTAVLMGGSIRDGVSTRGLISARFRFLYRVSLIHEITGSPHRIVGIDAFMLAARLGPECFSILEAGGINSSICLPSSGPNHRSVSVGGERSEGCASFPCCQ
jgi:hypothetical protein